MMKRKSSLTPPQEDKEQDDFAIAADSSAQNSARFQLEPLTLFLDDHDKQSDDEADNCGHIVIVDDDEMIINGDKVQELPLYPISINTEQRFHHDANHEHGENTVEEAAIRLFTDHQARNGEDSVSISMNSSRPQSTRLNKNVHFDMNAMHKVSSMDDIEEEESKASADEEYIDDNNNLLPSQVLRRRKYSESEKQRSKSRRKHASSASISKSKQKDKLEKITKLKEHIGHLKNTKTRKSHLKNVRLSQHYGLNQLKGKLMDAKLEKKDVSKMSNEQLQEMLIYINRIQWLILDEKQKRESCLRCGEHAASFVMLLPCRHQNICYSCSASDLQICPICHENVRKVVKPRKRSSN